MCRSQDPTADHPTVPTTKHSDNMRDDNDPMTMTMTHSERTDRWAEDNVVVTSAAIDSGAGSDSPDDDSPDADSSDESVESVESEQEQPSHARLSTASSGSIYQSSDSATPSAQESSSTSSTSSTTSPSLSSSTVSLSSTTSSSSTSSPLPTPPTLEVTTSGVTDHMIIPISCQPHSCMSCVQNNGQPTESTCTSCLEGYGIYTQGSEVSCVLCESRGQYPPPSHTNGRVRLRLEQSTVTPSASTYSGTVEVYLGDQWTAVCDDWWNNNNTEVVCRQLELGDAISFYTLDNSQAHTLSPIGLDDVVCAGNESSILQCAHLGITSHDCRPEEAVSITCAGVPQAPVCLDGCPPGYFSYTSSYECLACSTECLTCSIEAYLCDSCIEPYYLVPAEANVNPQGSRCVTHCPSGYYGDPMTRRCYSCPTDCTTCTYTPAPTDAAEQQQSTRVTADADDCAGCADAAGDDASDISSICAGCDIDLLQSESDDNDDTADTRSISCTSCSMPYILEDGQCVEQCAAGLWRYNYREDGVEYQTCVDQCPSGYVAVSMLINDLPLHRCEACTTRCKECEGSSDNCTRCSDDRVLQRLEDGELSCQTSCHHGYYADVNDTCVPCHDSDRCSSCYKGGAYCRRCQAGYLQELGRCVRGCSQGLYQVHGTCEPSCPGGYRKNQAAGSCQPCGAACRSCTPDGVCTSCFHNYYLLGGGCVRVCPEDHVSVMRQSDSHLRLLGGGTDIDGRLSLFYEGAWYSVCVDTGWDMAAAMIVCRNLQAGEPIQLSRDNRFGVQESYMHVRLNCSGEEDKIWDCVQEINMLADTLCTDKIPGVYCSGPDMSSANVCIPRRDTTCATMSCHPGVTCHDYPSPNATVTSWCGKCPAGMTGDGVTCTDLTEADVPPVSVLFPPRGHMTISDWPEGVAVALPCVNDQVDSSQQQQHTVSWYYNGNRIYTSLMYRVEPEGSLFILHPVGERYSGEYRCTISNGFADSHASYELTVQEEIILTSRPESQTGSENILLSCAHTGYPRPRVTWYRGNDVITKDEYTHINSRYTLEPDGSLTILQAVDSDAVVYTCVVENVYDRRQASATVTVRGPPQILHKTTAMVGLLGEPLSIDCVVSGDGPIRIGWKRLTDEDNERNATHRLQVLHNGTLHIPTVQYNDSGTYYCIATQYTGMVDVWYTIITVVEYPRVRLSPDTAFVVSGSQVAFRCHASGDPPPVITWNIPTRGTVALDALPENPESLVLSLDGSAIIIVNIQESDEGPITCTASSRTGEVTATATIHVKTPPNFSFPPQNRTILTGWQVTICWVIVGKPAPEVTWFRNDVLINYNLAYSMLPSGLQFHAQSSLSGKYTIKGSSTEGSIEGSAYVTVVEPLPRPVLISSTLHNATISLVDTLDVPPDESSLYAAVYEVVVVPLGYNSSHHKVYISPMDISVISYEDVIEAMKTGHHYRNDTTSLSGYVALYLQDPPQEQITIGEQSPEHVRHARETLIETTDDEHNGELLPDITYAVTIRRVTLVNGSRHDVLIASQYLYLTAELYYSDSDPSSTGSTSDRDRLVIVVVLSAALLVVCVIGVCAWYKRTRNQWLHIRLLLIIQRTIMDWMERCSRLRRERSSKSSDVEKLHGGGSQYTDSVGSRFMAAHLSRTAYLANMRSPSRQDIERMQNLGVNVHDDYKIVSISDTETDTYMRQAIIKYNNPQLRRTMSEPIQYSAEARSLGLKRSRTYPIDLSRFIVLDVDDSHFDSRGFEIFDERTSRIMLGITGDEKHKSDSGFESERHLKKMSSMSSVGTVSRNPKDIVSMMISQNSTLTEETEVQREITAKPKLYKKNKTDNKSRRRKLRGRKLKNIKDKSTDIWTRGVQWASNFRSARDSWPFTSSNSASGAESDDLELRSERSKSKVNPMFRNTSTDNDSSKSSDQKSKKIIPEHFHLRRSEEADKKFRVARAVVRATEAFANNREKNLARKFLKNNGMTQEAEQPKPSTSGTQTNTVVRCNSDELDSTNSYLSLVNEETRKSVLEIKENLACGCTRKIWAQDYDASLSGSSTSTPRRVNVKAVVHKSNIQAMAEQQPSEQMGRKSNMKGKQTSKQKSKGNATILEIPTQINESDNEKESRVSDTENDNSSITLSEHIFDVSKLRKNSDMKVFSKVPSTSQEDEAFEEIEDVDILYISQTGSLPSDRVDDDLPIQPKETKVGDIGLWSRLAKQEPARQEMTRDVKPKPKAVEQKCFFVENDHDSFYSISDDEHVQFKNLESKVAKLVPVFSEMHQSSQFQQKQQKQEISQQPHETHSKSLMKILSCSKQKKKRNSVSEKHYGTLGEASGNADTKHEDTLQVLAVDKLESPKRNVISQLKSIASPSNASAVIQELRSKFGALQILKKSTVSLEVAENTFTKTDHDEADMSALQTNCDPNKENIDTDTTITDNTVPEITVTPTGDDTGARFDNTNPENVSEISHDTSEKVTLGSLSEKTTKIARGNDIPDNSSLLPLNKLLQRFEMGTDNAQEISTLPPLAGTPSLSINLTEHTCNGSAHNMLEETQLRSTILPGKVSMQVNSLSDAADETTPDTTQHNATLGEFVYIFEGGNKDTRSVTTVEAATVPQVSVETMEFNVGSESSIEVNAASDKNDLLLQPREKKIEMPEQNGSKHETLSTPNSPRLSMNQLLLKFEGTGKIMQSGQIAEDTTMPTTSQNRTHQESSSDSDKTIQDKSVLRAKQNTTDDNQKLIASDTVVEHSIKSVPSEEHSAHDSNMKREPKKLVIPSMFE